MSEIVRETLAEPVKEVSKESAGVPSKASRIIQFVQKDQFSFWVFLKEAIFNDLKSFFIDSKFLSDYSPGRTFLNSWCLCWMGDETLSK